MVQPKVVIRAVIIKGDKIFVTNDPHTHGIEELGLLVSGIKQNDVITVRVDGKTILQTPAAEVGESMEEIVREHFREAANERGFDI